VYEGYGQTECTAGCTFTTPGDWTSGHVGAPLPCNHIKLVDAEELNYWTSKGEGEICVKGPNVFKGYLKDEDRTKEALDSDGWLHTGDIGKWLPEGTLKIIDRKKHIFKLAQGEYVAPEKIENIYIRSEPVAQIYVHGDSLKAFLVGIVVPDPDIMPSWAQKKGIEGTYQELCANQELKKAILDDLVALGKESGLYSFEQVTKMVVVVADYPCIVYLYASDTRNQLLLGPRWVVLSYNTLIDSPHALNSGGLKELRKITEKEELNRPTGSSSQPPSPLSVTGGESLQENDSQGKEAPDEKTPLNESVPHDFEIDSCSSSSELVSGLTLEHDVSSWLLSCSDTDSCTGRTAESRSSFSSPELFRGSDCLDWEHPKLEEYKPHKNSTLLDTSKAVTIEKAPQLANLSAILMLEIDLWTCGWTLWVDLVGGPCSFSEDYEKCHRNIGITLEAPPLSPEPKCTSNLASENAASEVIFAEKTGPPTTKKTKKKPEKESEDRGPQVETKLSSGHLDSKAPFSHHSSPLEIITIKNALLPKTLETVSKKSSTPPHKQSKALLTSTPSSDTADFVIDLSPVQNVSFEELFPNVSNCVNSSEIVPVSSWQESSSNEFLSCASELCCIVKASPGTRQMRGKAATVMKNCSPPTDVPP
ncbi:hypothetical protein STEG23_034423, partial [Scotinomys teguina]